MKNESVIETNPIAARRVNQIERSLRKWAARQIEFDFDPSGTNLFSMLELSRSYARRFVEFSSSIRGLIKRDQIIPATVVGRALIETVAMGSLYIADMNCLIEKGDRAKLDARLLKCFSGSKAHGRTPPVHVLDAMRHLEEIDSQYVKYLDEKYGLLSFASSLIASERGQTETTRERIIDELSVIRRYDLLSEVCHPNGLGTQFIYPDPSNETVEVSEARLMFRHAALASIWHGHHLLTSLETTTDWPERYRQAFLAPERPD